MEGAACRKHEDIKMPSGLGGTVCVFGVAARSGEGNQAAGRGTDKLRKSSKQEWTCE